MLSSLWKRAAEAAIAAIVVVVATMLSEELAGIARASDPDQGSEPEKKF
jgi:hypothetical protein